MDVIYPCYDARFNTDTDDCIFYQDGKFGANPADFDENKGFKYVWVCFGECSEVESYIFEYAIDDPVYLIYKEEAGKAGYVTNGQVYESLHGAEAIIRYGVLPEPYKSVGIEIKEDFETVGALIKGLEQVLKELKSGQQHGDKIAWSLQMKTGQEEIQCFEKA